MWKIIYTIFEKTNVFVAESVGVLEWICVIENGISKRYFKTSTMHTEGIYRFLGTLSSVISGKLI